MNPWRLIAILEKCDPTFQELFYPKDLRCPLKKRIVRAIEEHWPAYFPTRKECRGSNWSLSIQPDEPLYKPNPNSLRKLQQWKKDIAGTMTEGRGYNADISWRRFVVICRKSSRLRVYLRDLEPLANFLIQEESIWPRYGGKAVGMESFLQNEMAALLSSDSPYHYSDAQRLRFLRSRKQPVEKIQMIAQMRSLFDGPLMALAVLQRSVDESRNLMLWCDLRNHINSICHTSVSLTFRRTWLEHAMQMSGASKKSGMSCPRKWARLLLAGESIAPNEIDESEVTQKAIEVSRWLKGKKQPSVKNIRRSWQAVAAEKQLNPREREIGWGAWIFSWMITLLMERHCEEITTAFKGDAVKIRHYYQRFFYYLRMDFHKTRAGNEAGGRNARQP